MIRSLAGSIASLARGLGRATGRLIRLVAAPFGALAGFVHVTAEPAGVAQTMNQDGPGQHPTAIGGAMMVGAARRIGKATNEMPDEHDPERDWHDR